MSCLSVGCCFIRLAVVSRLTRKRLLKSLIKELETKPKKSPTPSPTASKTPQPTVSKLPQQSKTVEELIERFNSWFAAGKLLPHHLELFVLITKQPFPSRIVGDVVVVCRFTSRV